MSGTNFILVIPSDTRKTAALIPVDNIIPVHDLQMKPFSTLERLEAWSVDNDNMFYNARAANFLEALNIQVPQPIYNDIVITGSGCIPLSKREASIMMRFMNQQY